MKKVRVAINGFGRIGRVFFRQAFGNPGIEIIAINNPQSVESDARLLKYDSVYGIYEKEVSFDGDDLIVNGQHIKTLTEMDPKQLPWKELDIDLVIEATGVFRDREKAGWHLEAGAKKVILSAPPKGDVDVMLVMGVNENDYNPDEHHVISNASCTTNSLAPVVKVLQDTFGIKRGLMTTVHSYTNDQSTLDGSHRDPRRARAAAVSIIPTTTGAAEAVTKVIPELKGKLNGLALRVPTPVVSITDLVVDLEKDVTVEEVNAAISKAAEGSMKEILKLSDEPLVSADYKGNNHSSIVDGLSTLVMDNNMVKLLCWYDNEWGYSRRLLDLILFIGKKAE